MVDAKETLADARQGLATYMLRDFDTHYSLWNAAVLAAARLDCLLSLSYTADLAGEGAVCRPVLVADADDVAKHGEGPVCIRDGEGDCAFLRLRQSRHPCIR
jgi:DNA mismatch repair ATPase MutS